MKRRLLATVLIMILLLAGCNAQEPSGNLMDDVERNKVNTNLDVSKEASVTDFGVRLFQSSLDETKNTLISPISVLTALAMTANGAEEETLAQMEEVFGLSVSDLNEFLHAYMEALPEDEKYELHLANAIWFKQDEEFKVNEAFLQTNADYYEAGIYEAPFDKTTLKEINGWVSDKTKERIQNILDEIPEDAVMYLVNALAFDAEWDEIYKENQIWEDVFTQEDGTMQPADMMRSEEYQYLEDENATGLIKYYKDQKYAFAALLPKEGITVSDYVASLTGEALHTMLENSEEVKVNAVIPKFESEFDIEMSQVLIDMGMKNAFYAEAADFSGIGEVPPGYNLVINRVLHKTFLEVDEKGTEAGAATIVEIAKETSLREPEEMKEVRLDRPFVYMIIDCESNIPIFMGTVMSVE
ncbi:MAG: serpin family protein [Tyzzerella sp.]|nr:serpin family protein [Tyzzerella sp.]